MSADNKVPKVDKGWEQMKALLDKEMPIRNNRRKPFLYWILGGFAIMILALALFGLNDLNKRKSDLRQAKPASPTVHAHQSGFETNSEPENENLEIITNNLEEKEKPKVELLSNQNQELVSNHKNQIEFQTNELANAPAKVVESNSGYDSYSHLKNEIKRDLEQDQINEQLHSDDNPDNLTFISVSEQTHPRTVASVSTLPGMQDYSIKETMSLIELDINRPMIEIEPETEKKPKYALGGFLGINSENFTHWNFLSADAVISFPIAKKWNINAGLGYQYLQDREFNSLLNNDVRSFSESSVPLENNLTSFSSSGTTNSYTFSEQSQVVLKEQINSLHYIHLPVLVNLTAGKWNFETGFSGAYLLYADLDDAYSLNVPPQAQPSQGSLIRYNGNSTSQLNRFDFRWILGMGFTIGKKLQLGLQYHHGYVSILKTEFNDAVRDVNNQPIKLDAFPKKAFNRNFELKAGYWFGG